VIYFDCIIRDETLCTNTSYVAGPHKIRVVVVKNYGVPISTPVLHIDWFAKFAYSESFAVRSKNEWRTLMEVLCVRPGHAGGTASRDLLQRPVASASSPMGNTQYSWLVNRNGAASSLASVQRNRDCARHTSLINATKGYPSVSLIAARISSSF